MTTMDESNRTLYFRLFNEIGIISQLSRARAEKLMPGDLTMAHFTVLNHLTRVKDGQTPLAMARAFQIPKTSLTHTLAVLEDQRLVEMRPNPDDGRSKCVWLTDKGSQLHGQAIVSVMQGSEDLHKEIKPDEIESLLPVLVRIRQFLDEERN